MPDRAAPALSAGWTLQETSAPTEAEIAAVSDGLDAYNAAAVGAAEHPPLWFLARGPEGRLVGGVRCVLQWTWLLIDWVWVEADCRGRNVGTALIQAAERAGRARGCEGAYLNTFSFQAPGFYERLGYAEFGRLEGFPGEHARIWMSKAL